MQVGEWEIIEMYPWIWLFLKLCRAQAIYFFVNLFFGSWGFYEFSDDFLTRHGHVVLGDILIRQLHAPTCESNCLNQDCINEGGVRVVGWWGLQVVSMGLSLRIHLWLDLKSLSIESCLLSSVFKVPRIHIQFYTWRMTFCFEFIMST